MQSFYIGVKALLIKDDKVLLVKKLDENGYPFWDLPGGRINDTELPEQALLRELKEELPDITHVTVGAQITSGRYGKHVHNGHGLFLLFFTVTADIPQIQLRPQHLAYMWVGKDNLIDIGLDKMDGYIDKIYKHALEKLFLTYP